MNMRSSSDYLYTIIPRFSGLLFDAGILIGKYLFSAIIALFIFFPNVSYSDEPEVSYSDKNEMFCNSSCLSNENSTTPGQFCSRCHIFNYSGYIDGSYNYLVRNNKFISNSYNRVFDIERHGFTLHQAALTVSSQPKTGLGGLLNVIMGRDTQYTAAYGINPKWGSRSFGIDPLQAYLQLNAEKLTLIGGKYVTLAGYEGVDPTLNSNFSRSILWGFGEPTTHMGFRGTYAITDKFNFIAGINNGWDNIKDTSRHKTLELGTNYAFNSKFSLTFVGYSGGQRATDKTSFGPKGTRNLFDLIATFNATEKLTFVLNLDYARQSIAALPDDIFGRAIWSGIVGYINYKFNECWRTSIRGEIFDDKDGYRSGVRQTWNEVTLTIAFSPCKNIEIRAETRRDFSNKASFLKAHGNGVSQNQQSFALEGYYKFP